MTNYDSDMKEISIAEIMALGFRYLGFVLISTFVVGALTFGFTYKSSINKAQTAYEDALEAYEKEVQDAQEAIELSRNKIENYNFVIESIVKSGNTDSDSMGAYLSAFSKLTDEQQSIKNIQKKIEEKKEPVMENPGFAKKTVIGCVAGFFLSCLYLLISFLSKDPVVSSYDFESRYGIRFLGNLRIEKKWYRKVSSSILHERTWKDKQQSLDYVKSASKDVIEDKDSVLLITSLKDEICPEIAKCFGSNTKCLTNASMNATLLEEVKKYDKIVLVEKSWESRNLNVQVILNSLEQLEKQPSGVVLV